MTAIAASLAQDPLWTRARAMFARAVAELGDAAAIAVLTSLPRIVRRQIVAWLYPLECIVRRLLIAEAAELHRAERARAKRAVRMEYIPLRGMAQHWQASRPSSQREEGREEGRTTGRAPSKSSGGGEPHPARPCPRPQGRGTLCDRRAPISSTPKLGVHAFP